MIHAREAVTHLSSPVSHPWSAAHSPMPPSCCLWQTWAPGWRCPYYQRGHAAPCCTHIRPPSPHRPHSPSPEHNHVWQGHMVMGVGRWVTCEKATRWWVSAAECLHEAATVPRTLTKTSRPRRKGHGSPQLTNYSYSYSPQPTNYSWHSWRGITWQYDDCSMWSRLRAIGQYDDCSVWNRLKPLNK